MDGIWTISNQIKSQEMYAKKHYNSGAFTHINSASLKLWNLEKKCPGHEIYPSFLSTELSKIFSIYIHTGVGKSRFTVVSTRNTEFILVLLFIYQLLYYLSFCLSSSWLLLLLLLLLLFCIFTYDLSFK